MAPKLRLISFHLRSGQGSQDREAQVASSANKTVLITVFFNYHGVVHVIFCYRIILWVFFSRKKAQNWGKNH